MKWEKKILVFVIEKNLLCAISHSEIPEVASADILLAPETADTLAPTDASLGLRVLRFRKESKILLFKMKENQI